MSAPNLFRMDDFLLKGAWILGALGALAALAAFAASAAGQPLVAGGLGLGLVVFGFAPIAMALVGSNVRRRERRALSLWKLIDRHVELSSVDLFRDSDWTPAHLERAVRDLNNSGIAYVVWDRKAGLVQNGRLRRTTVVADECDACSNKVSLEVTIGSVAAMRCPYCHEPIDSARVAEEKARIIDELEVDRPRAPASAVVGVDAGAEKSGFSLVIFFVLFSVFWPAALWYCLRHRTHLAGLIR
jgi:hypothetical protein